MKTIPQSALAVAAVMLNCLSAFVPSAHAQGGVPLWTNTFNGSGNLSDFALAVAVDHAGNAFVTGQSDYNATDGLHEFVTMAYSSGGARLWTNRYRLSSRSDAGGLGIAVDNASHVFVTGSAQGPANVYYATLAYGTAGVPLWTNLYWEPGDTEAGASSVVVNGKGNVIVTGTCLRFGGASYSTVAYSPTGVPLWTNRYGGSGDCLGYDYAAAIAADPNGNVFVTGRSCASGVQIFATLAYSNDGTPLWTNCYSPGNGYAAQYGLAVDSNGNVFVTGSSVNSSGDTDYATIAYSNAGVPLWTNCYNGPGNTNDDAQAIAVDTLGNVFVTGTADNSDSTSHHYASVAYSNAGVPLWTNLYGVSGDDSDATSIATDRAGNVFVSGYPYTTVAYSAAGAPLWTNFFAGGIGNAIAVDASGSVIVTGTSVAGTLDYATIKYSSSIAPVRLAFQKLSNQLVLSWTNAGVSLQSAPAITGTFTYIPGATSPYTNSMTSAQQYFRLVAP